MMADQVAADGDTSLPQEPLLEAEESKAIEDRSRNGMSQCFCLLYSASILGIHIHICQYGAFVVVPRPNP